MVTVLSPPSSFLPLTRFHMPTYSYLLLLLRPQKFWWMAIHAQRKCQSCSPIFANSKSLWIQVQHLSTKIMILLSTIPYKLSLSFLMVIVLCSIPTDSLLLLKCFFPLTIFVWDSISEYILGFVHPLLFLVQVFFSFWIYPYILASRALNFWASLVFYQI